MTAAAPAYGRADPARRTLTAAAAIAAGCHVAIAAVGWVRPAPSPVPEPVVVVELPAGEAPPATIAPAYAPAAPPSAAAPMVTPAPALRASVPLPPAPAILPVPILSSPDRQAAPAPAQPAAPPVQAAVPPTGAGSGTLSAIGPAIGTDPHARAVEVDYFAMLSAYLNRRKAYPAEARRARQEGVVVVRFTVDRDGAVSGTAIKRSSGHDLLDQATLDLLQRVAPLPRMPATMQRQTVSLALPIAHTLKTS